MAQKKKGAGGMTSFLVLMLLAMFAYSVDWIRDGIGELADAVLAPLMSPFGDAWLVIILVLAGATGCYSSLLQKYTIDYKKMSAVQKKMKEFQKTYREAQLSGDEKKIRKLNEKRDRMMQDQMEMSQEQFKPMGWILIITIPIFLWMYWRIGEMSAAGTVPAITFPYLGTVPMNESAFFFLPAWILWYMLCSLMLSQVVRKTLDIGGL